ncbi:Actin-related protein 8 [Mycena sanguinolenta]|uniref:Actin-related protein 8 n=1 Tax=Mycena sanguinolenta TaxID=230812 RepID=A0A8H7DDM8_9AGAR|nr:Actin-related protein 8 [Mycena sanguinolenta]
MSHRSHSSKHALPDNPSYIKFTRSDGDSSLWPTNTKRVVDSEGCVNFMQPVGLDEPLSIKWRVGVGDAISVAKQLPNGRSYVLKDFPANYRMYDHHKGKADAPRHDVYLFGSDSRARFRSVPEFIPHAVWLMGDGSDACKCKYCTKKPQREITSSMGNLLRTSSTPSPTRPARPKTEKPEKKNILTKQPRLADRLQNVKTYAAVQKSVSLPKTSPHIQTKSVMLVERNNHLRDACRPASEGSLPRWFRDGELVWCSLAEPIMRPNEGDAIEFWPAIIDEMHNRVEPTRIPHDDVPADAASTPWRSYLLPDAMIIPYQTYLIPSTILQAMVDRPVPEWDLSPDQLTSFDPCPPLPGPLPTFSDALTPLALALQIASTLSGFWSLTDEWDAKLTLPPTNSLVPTMQIWAPFPTAPRGQGPPPPLRVVHQTRFQGFWWGGERIWADDLVRLKVPRNCLAPMGAQHIFAPSGPGPKSRSIAESRGGDPTPYGASSRGVFMKIDTIFLVEGSGKRECRVTGMLYELADLDWEDPNLPRTGDSMPNGAPATGQSAKLPSPGATGEFFALPSAPAGFKFRPILAPWHPLLTPILNDVIPLDPTTMLGAAHLWALEGLFGGYKNSVDPTVYKGNREKMLVDAEKDATAALHEHLREKQSDQMDQAIRSDEMDVDEA